MPGTASIANTTYTMLNILQALQYMVDIPTVSVEPKRSFVHKIFGIGNEEYVLKTTRLNLNLVLCNPFTHI